MSPNINTLRQHIYGMTSNVYFNQGKVKDPKPRKGAIDLLVSITQQGFTITNPEILFTMSGEALDEFAGVLETLIASTTKPGWTLRRSFGTQTELEEYTTADWDAILAQYAMTYGWEGGYTTLTGNNAEEVFDEYILTSSTKVTLPSKGKEIRIMNQAEYIDYIRSIMESKVPLRLQQEELLQQVDLINIDMDPAPKYTIKSTLALVQSSVYKQGGTPILRSVDEVMRFILNNCQQGDNDEDYNGQILKPMLKSFKFHMPTRMKKFILDWFNVQHEHEQANIVEQMYTHEQWWKRMFHHAHWCNADKFAVRYYKVKQILDRLYNTDRSWTFNSRLSAAEKASDYKTVAKLYMEERPGMLLRNLVSLCKFTTGAKLPKKEATSNGVEVIKGPKEVFNGAEYVLTKDFDSFLNRRSPSVKVCWEAIEELCRPVHEKPIKVRDVQGVTIYYSTPIPAIDKVVRDNVVFTLLNYTKAAKADSNVTLGKVYLEPETAGIQMQYSGANSNEMSISGAFLSPGTSLPLPEGTFIRMGVLWKDVGAGSCDIDLSTTIATSDKKYTCYYRHPRTEINGTLVATSSGDITSCNKDSYSTEFIDIDIAKAKAAGVSTIFNSLVMFSGRASIGAYDTHAFISVISPEERIVQSHSSFDIDLAKQDYAVKLTEMTNTYLGFSINLENDTMKSLAIGCSDNARGANAANLLEKFEDQISTKPAKFNVHFAVSSVVHSEQLVSTPEEADTVIGVSTNSTINVLTNAEQLTQIVF